MGAPTKRRTLRGMPYWDKGHAYLGYRACLIGVRGMPFFGIKGIPYWDERALKGIPYWDERACLTAIGGMPYWEKGHASLGS